MINLESKFWALGAYLQDIFFQCPTQCGVHPARISVRGHPAFACAPPITGLTSSWVTQATSRLLQILQMKGQSQHPLPSSFHYWSSFQKTGFQAVYWGSPGPWRRASWSTPTPKLSNPAFVFCNFILKMGFTAQTLKSIALGSPRFDPIPILEDNT